MKAIYLNVGLKYCKKKREKDMNFFLLFLLVWLAEVTIYVVLIY